MRFPDPLKAKMTKDGKFRVSVKVTEEVILTRDLSIEEARAFLAMADAMLREQNK